VKNKLFALIKSVSKIQVLAVLLVMIGLLLVVHYGYRTFTAFREMQYAYNHGFDTGQLDPELIRPWMNTRYIAVAYTVPQEFLFAELDIPFEHRSSRASLRHLNQKFELGQSPHGKYPAIMDQVRQAIEKYRQDPVVTGLEGHIRPWMSIQYIANSTGVPADYIFEQIGIPFDDNAYLPLDALEDKVDYQGGLWRLQQTIEQALQSYKDNNP